MSVNFDKNIFFSRQFSQSIFFSSALSTVFTGFCLYRFALFIYHCIIKKMFFSFFFCLFHRPNDPQSALHFASHSPVHNIVYIYIIFYTHSKICNIVILLTVFFFMILWTSKTDIQNPFSK